MKKLLQLTAISLLILMTMTSKVSAYAYEVVLNAGLYGAIDDSQEIVLDCALNDRVEVTVNSDASTAVIQLRDSNGDAKGDAHTLVLNDEKYYIKGMHISGQEFTETNAFNYPVEKDAKLVFAYGSKAKEQIRYFVYYVDPDMNPLTDDDGNPLLDDNGDPVPEREVFMGNPGSHPVVAYKHIDGYQPQAYQQTASTRVLEDWGDDENDPRCLKFYFIYTKLEAESDTTTVYDETYKYEYLPGGGGTGGGTGGGGGNTEPSQIIDIDDPEPPVTPTPDPEPGPNPEPEPEPEPTPDPTFWQMLLEHPWLLAGIGGGSVLLLIFLLLLFRRRRRND
ncbi:MAG: hypothetical protein IKS51_05520 [Erysipelotrichaceae bacterium]|nr:hypothetical protein [Erysipelotrichaceae bacterium]